MFYEPFKGLCHLSLLLILLTFICQNSESNDEFEMDRNVRKNFFNDIENFFGNLFKPKKKSYTSATTKKNVVVKKNRFTVKISAKKLKPTMKPLSRRVPKCLINGLRSDILNNVIKDIYTDKHPAISDLEISKLFNISLKAYKDDDESSKNYRGDNRLIVSGKRKHADGKSLIIIVTKTKKMEEEGLVNDLSEDFTTEDVKKRILRDEYGIACIQVAVKKCFKALRAVNSRVCKTRYTCKSSFKSAFKSHAKRSCIAEFDPTEEVIVLLKGVVHSRVRGNKKRDTKYADQCLPHLVSEYANTVHSSYLNKTSKILTRVLRGRPERKCQKLLREKCMTACNRAISQTCMVHACGKHKQKVYKKECRTECISKYLINSDTSESSESDSDE